MMENTGSMNMDATHFDLVMEAVNTKLDVITKSQEEVVTHLKTLNGRMIMVERHPFECSAKDQIQEIDAELKMGGHPGSTKVWRAINENQSAVSTLANGLASYLEDRKDKDATDVQEKKERDIREVDKRKSNFDRYIYPLIKVAGIFTLIMIASHMDDFKAALGIAQ